MHCPICSSSDKMDFRTFVVALVVGLLVGFLGGQFFYAYQIKPLYQSKNEKLEAKNEELRMELRKGSYIPVKPMKGAKDEGKVK